MPPFSPTLIRCRTDIYVRTPDWASYISTSPSPAATYVMGAATELAQHEKTVQHQSKFHRLDDSCGSLTSMSGGGYKHVHLLCLFPGDH